MKNKKLSDLILFEKQPEYKIASDIIENGDEAALSALITFCRKHSLDGNCGKRF